MSILVSGVLLMLGLLIAWRADAVGRVLKRLDGGRLQRAETDFGSDARAYTFHARVVGMICALFGAVALAGILISGWALA